MLAIFCVYQMMQFLVHAIGMIYTLSVFSDDHTSHTLAIIWFSLRVRYYSTTQ